MKRLVTVSLLVCGGISIASAQTAPVRLTVEDSIERGLAANPRLDELRARQDAARAVEGQREAAELPQIVVLGGYTRINHVEEFGVPNPSGAFRVIYPDIPDQVRSRIDLQWPIYTAGRLQALTRAAGAETNALEHDREAARADLKLEITRAFWAVITARASSDVLRQALERTSAHLEDVRNQFNVGLVPPSDVLTTEAQLARQRMLSIEADTLIETTTAEFRRLAGVDQDVPVELVPPAVTSSPIVAPFEGVAAKDLRVDRPERTSLNFRIAAAQDRVAAASAGSLPVLTAIAGYDMARPNLKIFPIQEKWRPSWDVGINVRWSLFDGGRVRAETAEAAAGQRAAEARLRDFDAIVQVEVRQRLAEVKSSFAEIEAASTGARAAAEARRVIAERFSAGVATNTDVINAQSALLFAELEVTRARANAELASARLMRALGR
jgi:outer membrane protein